MRKARALCEAQWSPDPPALALPGVRGCVQVAGPCGGHGEARGLLFSVGAPGWAKRASCRPPSHPQPLDCVTLLPRTRGCRRRPTSQPWMFGFSRAIVIPGGRGCGHARSSDRGTQKGPCCVHPDCPGQECGSRKAPGDGGPDRSPGEGPLPLAEGAGHGQWVHHNTGGVGEAQSPGS